MRKLFYHVDINSAFLSMEAAYRVKILGHTLDLRDIPAAIGGNKEDRHGIILAKSIPCKRYGIQTGEPINQALSKCPGLVVERANYGLYVEASRYFVSILRRYTPVVDQYSIDECWMDMSGIESAEKMPVMVAMEIKDTIKYELGFTVNIGVSDNKILAKMASDFRKPDRVHTLFTKEIELKLWPLPVRDLFFVGGATESKLIKLGIHTIGELATADPEMLRSHLKSHGDVVYSFANGCGSDERITMPESQKGYGNSFTVPFDVKDSETAHAVLLSLCETVGARMRADGSLCRLMTVRIRSNELIGFTHQIQMEAPTDATSEIYKFACISFDKAWDKRTPIRQLGVRVGKITDIRQRQYNIWDKDYYDRLSQVDHAVDAIRMRYGEDAILRARFANGNISSMIGGLHPERRKGIIGAV